MFGVSEQFTESWWCHTIYTLLSTNTEWETGKILVHKLSWKRPENCISLMLRLCIFGYNLDLRVAYKAVTCCCKERKVLLSPPFSAGYSNLHSLLDISQSYLTPLTLPFGRIPGKWGSSVYSTRDIERNGSEKYQSLLKKNVYGNSHCHAW